MQNTAKCILSPLKKGALPDIHISAFLNRLLIYCVHYSIYGNLRYKMASILLGAAVLFIVVIIWFFIYYWLSPHVDSPDGKARITGQCGDTMEIYLRFKGDRVVESASWTDGCAFSLNCAYVAAELAKGKTLDEILEIDPDLVQKSIGGLPPEQIHCAQLSVETLHAAIDDYMKKQRSRSAANPTEQTDPRSGKIAIKNRFT
jgi:nitrogen fixation NifU-like protein